MPVAAQVAVVLGLLAGLPLALEPIGRGGEELPDLHQAFLLRGQLEDLLPGLQVELYASGDREREVPVRRLYLYPDRALGRRLHDPLEEGDALLREHRNLLLRLLLEVLDVPDVIGLAGEDAVEPEAPRSLDQDQHPPILVALDELHYPRRASHLPRAGLIGQDHPELALALQALVDHLLVALLEDVQRQRSPWHEHHVQREKRYVRHAFAPFSAPILSHGPPHRVSWGRGRARTHGACGPRNRRRARHRRGGREAPRPTGRRRRRRSPPRRGGRLRGGGDRGSWRRGAPPRRRRYRRGFGRRRLREGALRARPRDDPGEQRRGAGRPAPGCGHGARFVAPRLRGERHRVLPLRQGGAAA